MVSTLPDGIEYVRKMDAFFRSAEADDVESHQIMRFLKLRPYLVEATEHKVEKYEDLDLLVHTFRNPDRGYVIASYRGNVVNSSLWVVKHTEQERDEALDKILEKIRSEI